MYLNLIALRRIQLRCYWDKTSRDKRKEVEKMNKIIRVLREGTYTIIINKKEDYREVKDILIKTYARIELKSTLRKNFKNELR